MAAFNACVARHPELLAWSPPVAGPVAFAGLAASEGAAAFCRRLADDAGVMLLPSTVFDYGDAHVRIGLGRAGFAEGLDVLEGWLARSGR